MTVSSTLIRDMRNLGPKTEVALNALGIYTRGDLKNFGVIETFIAVSMQTPHLNNLMLLYALEAAMRDVHVFSLPEEVKAELRKSVGRG